MSASLAAVPTTVWTRPEAISTPIWAFIPKYHVWMPPFAQEGFERLDHVIGCGHVSGLQVRPDRAAGRYGDTRTWRKSLERALSSLALIAFPGPDLTDHLILPFVDLLTRPTFPNTTVALIYMVDDCRRPLSSYTTLADRKIGNHISSVATLSRSEGRHLWP